jgi:hypothetical protein
MESMTRLQAMPRVLLASAILVVLFGALSISRSSDSSAETATPGATTTPMAEATVDNVIIRLLSWEQTDTFSAEIELVNNSPDVISVPQSAMQFEGRLPDGTSVVHAPRSSSPANCALSSGLTGRMTLEFDSSEGEIPVSLTIGISEPYRTGAHVVFPLDSNQGPSAFGGNAMAGAPATAASPEISSSPVATPAYECTD